MLVPSIVRPALDLAHPVFAKNWMLVYGDTVYTDKKPDGAPWKEYPPEHGLISLGLAHGASSRKVICDYTFTDLPKTAVFLGLDTLRSSTGANNIYIGVIGLDSGGISLGNGTAAGPGARQSCAVTSPKSALSTVYQITTITATDWVCWQGGLKKSVSFSGSGGYYCASGTQLHSGWNTGTPGAESNKLFFVLVSNSAIPSAAARALSDDPIGILFSEPSLPIWVPSSGSSSILCTVGNANATGVTALISRSIPCAVGSANASGVTASIATGSSTTITCSVGNANASGVAALVSLSITAAVGNANASGVTALITSGATTITCSVGNANASGVSALILGGAVTIPCTVGDAQATGVPSMVVFKTPTPAKPPGSGATGSGSNARAVLPKWPTVGPVVDANGKMAQPWLHWFSGMYDRLVDTYSHQTPTDGAYISVADGVSTLILDPAGPLASVAVRLPSTARDGMHLRITSTKTITLLYLWPADGQSLNSSPPTLAADTQIEFIFRTENRTWYRLQ